VNGMHAGTPRAHTSHLSAKRCFPGKKPARSSGVAERGVCKNRAIRQTTACRRSPFHRDDRCIPAENPRWSAQKSIGGERVAQGSRAHSVRLFSMATIHIKQSARAVSSPPSGLYRRESQRRLGIEGRNRWRYGANGGENERESSFTTQAGEYGAEWPVSRGDRGATRDATIYGVTMLAGERFPRHAAASRLERSFRHLTAQNNRANAR